MSSGLLQRSSGLAFLLCWRSPRPHTMRRAIVGRKSPSLLHISGAWWRHPV